MAELLAQKVGTQVKQENPSIREILVKVFFTTKDITSFCPGTSLVGAEEP
jgi:hypothetical protein